MIAVDVNATRPYSFPDDKDTPPTVFHLGYLDPQIEAMINDTTTRYQMNNKGPDAMADAIVSSDQRDIDTVRHGLRGWENFNDAAGNPVTIELESAPTKFGPKQAVSIKSIKRLPLARIKMLAKEIRSNGIMTEEEEKNSGSPSA